MHEVLERLERMRVLPVVTIDEANQAVPLADALIAGGLPCIELTLRTNAGLDALAALQGREDLLVGAGTVTTPERARQAIERGARFLVSPGLDEEIVQIAHDAGVLAFPGVSTATEVQRAARLGLGTVKLFPATAIGGIPVLKALAGPFPDMRFCPTGGISEGNVVDWLARSEVPFCGGSWMVPRDEVAAGDFDGIRARVERAVALVAS